MILFVNNFSNVNFYQKLFIPQFTVCNKIWLNSSKQHTVLFILISNLIKEEKKWHHPTRFVFLYSITAKIWGHSQNECGFPKLQNFLIGRNVHNYLVKNSHFVGGPKRLQDRVRTFFSSRLKIFLICTRQPIQYKMQNICIHISVYQLFLCFYF